MKEVLVKNTALKLLFITSFLLVGLFHEYTACLFLALEFIYLDYLFYKQDIYVFDNLNFIFMIFIIFMYLFVSFFAIDQGMAIIGFFKQLSILMFIIILMQFDKQDRKELLFIIPYMAILMMGVSVASYIIKPLQDYFLVNVRIGGFFQYPNTFALFLLVSLVVVYKNKEKYFHTNVFFPLLIIGIVLTGSRTAYILTVLLFVYIIKNNQEYLKVLLPSVLLIVAVIVLFLVLNIDTKVFKRITQFTLSSSTLLGRLLYYKDGLKTLISHPLGTGYLGFYFLEPSIQTGVYSIRYIHNDILQLALDVGIIPCLMFISIIVTSLISESIEEDNKLIIILIVLHSLFEFNLQYISIFLILVICLDLYDGKQTKFISFNHRIMGRSFIILSTLCSFYLSISMSFRYFNNNDLSIKLLPIYTEAKLTKLQYVSNVKEAVKLAKSVEKYDSNIASIYDVYALNEMQKKNYNQMISYKEQSLQLQKYNMEAYDSYISMLTICVNCYQNDKNLQSQYVQKIKEVPTTLDNLKKDTDHLAFKIHDKPTFKLSKQSQKIIKLVNKNN